MERSVPVLSATPYTSNVFQPRVNIKPYEYPDLLKYVDAIRHAYWVHTEFNYTPDIQDMLVTLSPEETQAINRTMLAISQVEASVKTFWGDMYKHLPKPEIAKVGATFAESEVRHEDAYSALLEKMGLNEEFLKIKEIPAMHDRLMYINKVNTRAKTAMDPRDYFEAIIFFSMLIENVSLFSQFYIIMAFNKYKNVLKGISNAVEATSKEEDLHAHFGFDLINIIKEENPEWFSEGLIRRIYEMAESAYKAEMKVLDWIYAGQDLEVAPREVINSFVLYRINMSLQKIGLSALRPTTRDMEDKFKWFEDELSVTKNNDFFQKRSTNYTKNIKGITEEDLF
jgi:ribonucleoside-diphosphate reductase beta chain